MKRFLAVFWMFALMCGLAFATGAPEAAEKIPIRLVHGYADFYQPMMDRFERENPEAEVVWIPKGGGVVAVDALLAAKVKPNVFMSTPGELGKFLIPGFALDLQGTSVDIDDFKDGALDIYYRDGQLLALPVLVSLNAFDVNLTLAKKVGIDVSAYKDRDYLTTDEFMEFGRAIKARGAPDEYATCVWAGNLGSQSVNWHWLSAFGARFYEDGDYSHTILNSPEAVRGMNYMKALVDKGYAPPEAPVLDDDEGIAFWAAGKIGGLWARAGGWLTMIDNAIKQGRLDKRFEHIFMTWPVAPGVEGNPLTYGGAAGMVIDSGDETINALSVKLLDIMTGHEAQEKTIGPGAGYGTRKSVVVPEINPDYDPGGVHYWKIGDLYDKYGGLDLGYSTTYMTAMNQIWLSVFQPFIKGEISAQEALETFEKKFNKVLAGE